ncbi:MAG TPA: mercuric reductase [Aggregatilineales bacterium]|nr:mercuric reductase [Aggregatilineales bacterium]HQA66963.1 mercuric reductase [Aggregatilineales bacterium]HQE18003.1 mercuric reductase [Aggregatilineales bacterium]
MTDRRQFDGIVIGAGQAGGPLATALARAGWQMAVIEREFAGGTCINWGCTPTKTLAASARVAYLARRAGEYGVQTGEVGVDMGTVHQRMKDIVLSWRASSRSAIEDAEGVTYIEGEASFLDARTVQVRTGDDASRTLSAARAIFINTGQRPRIPEIDGLEDAGYLTNVSILELETLPEHLIILGGGYVGLEFGQMFRRFGSEVTIIDHGPRCLRREDDDVAEAATRIVRDEGVTVYTGTTVERVERCDDGTLRLSARTPNGPASLRGSHLLVAAGRIPNTDRLNLPAAGIETDERGYIRTNDWLETTAPGVYALGDVKGGPAFTHVSYDDFRIVRDRLLGDQTRSARKRLIPYVVFIDPQLAHIGLKEHEARQQGYRVRVARLPMSDVARAVETSETRGFMKAVVDADTGQILGATVLGAEGGEIVSMLEIAMMGGLPYTALRDGIFAHPLLAESLNNLFARLDEGDAD